MSTPHPNNFCGCGYKNWLEVNLIKRCNAKCSWCIEKKGWHPEEVADWKTICDAAIKTGRKNIILLGGEPTLHPDIDKIVLYLREAGRNPWITTNGALLSEAWVTKNLLPIEGVNISIHHYNLDRNEEIVGIRLDERALRSAIAVIRGMGKKVRLNCNCIETYIDSEEELHRYVAWAKEIGASDVRFAELKFADDKFVDISAMVDHKYDTNDDPYHLGCSVNGVIDGMKVNFRLMCGMQTAKRPYPNDPIIRPHPVLYYDGNIYAGWQQKEKEGEQELEDLLQQVAAGEVSVDDALTAIFNEDKSDSIQFENMMDDLR